MAIENLTATRLGTNAVQGNGWGGTCKSIVATVAVTAAATDASTYDFADIDQNARIMGASVISWDDLTAAGAPTFDVGLKGGGVTADPDALTSGLDVTSAGSASMIADIANYGKKAWEHVNGQTTAPLKPLTVYGSLVDADASLGGTVTVEIFYMLD